MKIFHKLVSSKEAIQTISDQMKEKLEEIEVKIQNSVGMVCSRNVFSHYDVPSFDRSEVDGYAVFHEDVEGASEDSPKKLKLHGSIMAGDQSSPELVPGSCIYIATGAIIPRGCDAVVMIEDTRDSGEGIEIFRSVYPGENIAFAGTDISMESLLVTEHSVVTPEIVGAIAASGISTIRVYRKMKVGVFSTGNEIVLPGQEISRGEVFDTNSFYFMSRLDSTGIVTTTFLGTVRDDESMMADFLKRNANQFDVLIASGSTSAGFYDVLYKVIEDIGGQIIFHGINIKPGKPTFFGMVGTTLFIGMPGFPLSSSVILNYVVIPALFMALDLEYKTVRKVIVPYRINTEKSQEAILPVILAHDGRCYPIPGNSGSISRILYADGLISIPSDLKYLDTGESVDYMPINELPSKIISMGSSDPLLDSLVLSVDRHAKIVNIGSWGGMNAMKIDIPDISGVHILKDGVYNLAVMDDKLSKQCYLIRGFSRNRGFVSRALVSGFEEIAQRKLVFVNRNRGSGARDLIEEMLGPDDNLRKAIRGYLWESNTEAGVARAVSQGRADVGLSLQYYADALNLVYSHIREEEFDLLVSKNFYNSETGHQFILRLKSLDERIRKYIGYKVFKDTGEIISETR